MNRLRRMLIGLAANPCEKSHSVEEIVARMQPTDESKLRLPRSYANTMSVVLEVHRTRQTKGNHHQSDQLAAALH